MYRDSRRAVSPVVIGSDRDRYPFLLVRVDAADVAGTLASINRIWEARAPEYPFEYAFQDDKLRAQYDEERRLADFFRVFSLLVVLIAALGLFGLAAFTAQRRTREVGIRKVLGATATQIVLLLSRDVTVPVAIALLVASPAGLVGRIGLAFGICLPGSRSRRGHLFFSALLLLLTAWGNSEHACGQRRPDEPGGHNPRVGLNMSGAPARAARSHRYRTLPR